MKKINKPNSQKVSKTFEEHEPQLFTLYPNELIDFLGGAEPLKKLNIYGHRIIYVIMEMLKTTQVHKISANEAKEIISNDLTIKDGRFISLAEIKAEEIEKRRILESGKKLAIIEENYFADNFNMFQMIIPTKALNDNGNIKVKDNSVFNEQLQIMKTLGTHKVKSQSGNEVLTANFIELPIYNKGDNYVRFYISKPTAQMLLNNIDGYSKVYRSILFSTPSTMPLNVYLYIKKKLGKMNGGNIGIKKFVSELGLAEHYYKKSKLIVFLTGIKNKLNEIGNISFGFTIQDENIVFSLYETKNTVLVEYSSNDEYKASNALKYIKKKRKLDEKQILIVKKKFNEHGYEKMSAITASRLNAEITGIEYLKWFINKCLEMGL
ncbi:MULTISPECIES: hypothetical protein [unclassified Chryseobacterium]|uniref:hypothetical protein n=1 Tax=unclassified Chryseobacterium TaxID=2593645 RepID=UPI00301799C5